MSTSTSNTGAPLRFDAIGGGVPILALGLICPSVPATMNAEPRVVVTTGGDPADWLEPALVNEYTGTS